MMGSIPRVDRDITVHDYIPGQPIPALVRDRQTGKIVVNELKRYVKPFTLLIEPKSLTLAASGISASIPMPIDDKGHLEILQAFFTSQRAEGFTVELFDPDNRPFLMNREVHVATIASGGGVVTGAEVFGTDSSAGRPFIWPESLFLNVRDKGKALFARFRNLSTNTNTIRFGLHGLRWYHVQAPTKIADRMHEIYHQRDRTMPYFYTTDRNVVLNSAVTPASFVTRFTDDGWTEVLKLMVVSTQAFDVRLLETASEKRFMEDRIRSSLVFGNGELPFLMWESSLFEPNYKLTWDLLGTSSSANTIWITMGCRRIFFDPKDDRLARP